MRIVWSGLLVISLGLVAWGAIEAGQEPTTQQNSYDDGSGFPPPPPPPTGSGQ